MGWKAFFSSVDTIEPEALHALNGQPDRDYTLLDVRQPGEYRKEHLPGARLIPLPDLQDRASEIPADKPVIVYCAIGGRSNVAARVLKSMGYSDVTSLKGGINAVSGAKAVGPKSRGLELLPDLPSTRDMLLLALGMERGLGGWYADLSRRFAENGELTALFTTLVAFEKNHAEKVLRMAEKAGMDPAALAEEAARDVAEGGYSEQTLYDMFPAGTDIRSALDTAMAVEAQAQDLYLRLGREIGGEAAGRMAAELADEERIHLRALSSQMDRLHASD